MFGVQNIVAVMQWEEEVESILLLIYNILMYQCNKKTFDSKIRERALVKKTFSIICNFFACMQIYIVKVISLNLCAIN